MSRNSSLSVFKHNGAQIFYNQYAHHLGLFEVFILDIYRSHLLKQNDIVLDLGAGIGDFSILASKIVGSKGTVIAIEPNLEDFKLLQLNIKANGCSNIIALNLGVGSKSGQREVSFWNKSYEFRVDTLENILQRCNVASKISFIKMDIEGFELEVAETSIETIKKSDFVSLEFHGTKEKIDKLLSSSGFHFRATDGGYLLQKILVGLLQSPHILLGIFLQTLAKHPRIFYRAALGLDRRKECLLIGTYARKPF